MDDKSVLDLLLGGQGGVCAITNTLCYTWINTSNQMDSHTEAQREINLLSKEDPDGLASC